MPISGCAIATGLIWSSLIRGSAYAPDRDSALFNHAVIGFAFIETFAFMLVAVSSTVISF
jgi:F0F1-type ATP synthase membrane subunit c/vacuolar-type H+-ATPase subunit K